MWIDSDDAQVLGKLSFSYATKPRLLNGNVLHISVMRIQAMRNSLKELAYFFPLTQDQLMGDPFSPMPQAFTASAQMEPLLEFPALR
jgi:hypothetical protein